jgi:hypothetical protein
VVLALLVLLVKHVLEASLPQNLAMLLHLAVLCIRERTELLVSHHLPLLVCISPIQVQPTFYHARLVIHAQEEKPCHTSKEYLVLLDNTQMQVLAVVIMVISVHFTIMVLIVMTLETVVHALPTISALVGVLCLTRVRRLLYHPAIRPHVCNKQIITTTIITITMDPHVPQDSMLLTALTECHANHAMLGVNAATACRPHALTLQYARLVNIYSLMETDVIIAIQDSPAPEVQLLLLQLELQTVLLVNMLSPTVSRHHSHTRASRAPRFLALYALAATKVL